PLPYTTLFRSVRPTSTGVSGSSTKQIHLVKNNRPDSYLAQSTRSSLASSRSIRGAASRRWAVMRWSAFQLGALEVSLDYSNILGVPKSCGPAHPIARAPQEGE